MVLLERFRFMIEVSRFCQNVRVFYRLQFFSRLQFFRDSHFFFDHNIEPIYPLNHLIIITALSEVNPQKVECFYWWRLHSLR
jgi:hypothetical protein